MPNPSKRNGGRIEQEVVRLHLGAGIPAERIPLSGASGGLFSGDIVIGEGVPLVSGGSEGQERRSELQTLEGWLGDHDLLFLRRDLAKPLVVLGWGSIRKTNDAKSPP